MIVPTQSGELHLVAIPCRKSGENFSSFWGYFISSRLYSSCLYMLNHRCLGLVFDLDETLLVANTLRSFEDKIEALNKKMKVEIETQRISYIMAELKCYEHDKSMLRSYAESDKVVDNGRVVNIQSEVVPSLSVDHPSIIRPLIRLQEKNIILTRINPVVRDTSILVRLRPAWDDLKRYLITDGRKRFEVYVCTMADRDYALEMWRLLDPDFNLIPKKELLSRIVCVKSGSRKSLLNVFDDVHCDSKMALIIDDRLNVWDVNDQAQVHVVPAFTPYHSSEEENGSSPGLFIAKNVARHVRGHFFKYFDEGFQHHIQEISYEDDVHCIPSPPSVARYLDLKDSVRTSFLFSESNATEMKIQSSLNLDKDSVHSGSPIPTFQISSIHPSNKSIQWPEALSFRDFGNPDSRSEVLEPELDPDERRRLLILQHGKHTEGQRQMDMKAAATQRSLYSVNTPAKRKQQPRNASICYSDEEPYREDGFMFKDSASNHPSLSEVCAESGWDVTFGDSPPEVLQSLALSCGVKVQFKPSLIATNELHFRVEVWFGGERIGMGTGRTRKEAQFKAAECSLQLLECASQMRRDTS